MSKITIFIIEGSQQRHIGSEDITYARGKFRVKDIGASAYLFVLDIFTNGTEHLKLDKPRWAGDSGCNYPSVVWSDTFTQEEARRLKEAAKKRERVELNAYFNGLDPKAKPPVVIVDFHDAVVSITWKGIGVTLSENQTKRFRKTILAKGFCEKTEEST